MRFTPQLRDLSWLVARPIAHRGLHDVSENILENTESAFAAAIKHNYAIECDLQLTADGEAMVFHDETLDRLTTQKGWVRDFATRELQAANFKTGQDHMQTLDELLDQVYGQVTLVIELKSHFDSDTRLATRAVEVLANYTGPYCLMSFDPDMVAAVAALSPGTVRGITADRTVDAYYNTLPLSRRLAMRNFSHLEKTRPHFVSYAFEELPFAPVTEIHRAGHPVISWTIRSEQEAALARRYSDQITFEGFLPA
jgi:glycerophosphoryl diester phosphodiesterase